MCFRVALASLNVPTSCMYFISSLQINQVCTEVLGIPISSATPRGDDLVITAGRGLAARTGHTQSLPRAIRD